MTMFHRFGQLACAVVLATSLSGCALFISDPEERAEVIETNDPIEGVNRHIFAVNLALDTFILRPVSVVYREFMPDPGKDMVRNFVHNLKLPFTAINDLLQGEPDRAETAISRFLVNSTAGIGGLFDAATGLGLEYHEEDFGQTLAVHGSEEGPYLMLPIFGPSNLRDAIGLVVQYFGDPAGIAADEAGADNFGMIRGGMEAVDTRARHIESFDALQQQSLDFYAAVRSLYRQRREAEIRNFESEAMPGTPIAKAPGDAPQSIAAAGDEPDRELIAATLDPGAIGTSNSGGDAAAAGTQPVQATTAMESSTAAAPAASSGIAPAPEHTSVRAEPGTETPSTGAPSTGAPSTGAPATGAPSTGAPATQPVADQLAALPESPSGETGRLRLDDTGSGNISASTEERHVPARHPSAGTTAEPGQAPGTGRMASFAEALRAFDEAARSFDAMTGAAPEMK